MDATTITSIADFTVFIVFLPIDSMARRQSTSAPGLEPKAILGLSRAFRVPSGEVPDFLGDLRPFGAKARGCVRIADAPSLH
jgi:hypothetical protein